MVMFCEWHRTVSDQKISHILPMTDEDTGLGAALAQPLAGYLGKVQERAASFEQCPWCAAKGLNYPLRSYHINLQDTIILCTNPQCLFPLVSRPLEDILASLVPAEPQSVLKRKQTEASETHGLKRHRSSTDDDPVPQSIADLHVSKADGSELRLRNGQHPASKTEVEEDDGELTPLKTMGLTKEGERSDLQGQVPTRLDSSSAALVDMLATDGPQHCSSLNSLTTEKGMPLTSPLKPPDAPVVEDGDLSDIMRPPRSACMSGDPDPSLCGLSTEVGTMICLSPRYKKLPVKTEPDVRVMESDEISTPKGDVDMKACPDDLSQGKSKVHPWKRTRTVCPLELVPVPPQLFWKNVDNLCWLDTLLVALVNIKTLRKYKPKEEPQQSPIWQLMETHDQTCAMIQAHQQTDADGVLKVPKGVLQRVNKDLQSLRMSIFQLLQPKLHCQLGDPDMPVFALPLLLTADSWAEPLFQVAFRWEFECSDCKMSTMQKVTMPLPTFTNVVPDWHPLNAAHLAPCNTCSKMGQKRVMMLEGVPPVFALHFVEGLPDNNVGIYSFNYQEKRYAVTTVIQYDQEIKHFVTWIRQFDGSWLEFDDLKHPHCVAYAKLPVPPQDIHIIFWESEADTDTPPICSPSTTMEPPLSRKEIGLSLSDDDVGADEELTQSPDQSIFASHNDTEIIGALTITGDNGMDTTVAADASLCSTTLLDAFEGLTHSDIITLTLSEVKVDMNGKPLDDAAASCAAENKDQEASPSPDTSCSASELLPNPEEPEPGDNSSIDPAFTPASKSSRGRGRGKGRNQPGRTAKKDGSAKVTPTTLAESTPPVDTNDQASPVLPPQSSPQTRSELPSSLDHNTRWSYLLSRHPLATVHPIINNKLPSQKPAATPIIRRKPREPVPIHSTPNTARKQQAPVGSPKCQLRRADMEDLPLKAAAMYGSFRTKGTDSAVRTPHTPHNPQTHAFTAPLNGISTLRPPASQKSPVLNTMLMVSKASPPPPVAMAVPKISPEKLDSRLVKTPSSTGDTDILRYKLLKKLKAKKKKLEKLNQMLGNQGAAGGEPTPRPDSTDLSSPQTVSSSTYEGSTYDEFFADLLSPATTVSNLSPDSTDFLLAGTQEGGDYLDTGRSIDGGVSQVNMATQKQNNGLAEVPDLAGYMSANDGNLLEEFISGAATQQQAEIETEVLSELELFNF